MSEILESPTKTPKEYLITLLAPAFCIGLLIPGARHVLEERILTALLLQGILIGVILTACLTRLITYPVAIPLIFFLIAVIHFLSAIGSWRHTSTRSCSWRIALRTASFSAFFGLLLIVLFLNKSALLGINLYYIPSTSMQPTLQPGDIILVDTWAYHSTPPTRDDIATFHDPIIPARTLIKRVADTKATKFNTTDNVFFRGDNATHSSDSRQFGWINIDQVTGKYVCTLPCFE